MPPAESTAVALQVLLVENSATLAAHLREAIEQLPAVHLVAVVDGEAAALTALERYAPDLLLLDLSLQDGSGFGVLRHLRAKRSVTETIIYSSHSTPAIRREAEKLGATTFFDKARDFDRLFELLLRRSDKKVRSLARP